MSIRKFLRILIKIPATPFYVAFILYLLLLAYIFYAFEWIYEKDMLDSRNRIVDLHDILITWFTTI